MTHNSAGRTQGVAQVGDPRPATAGTTSRARRAARADCQGINFRLREKDQRTC